MIRLKKLFHLSILLSTQEYHRVKRIGQHELKFKASFSKQALEDNLDSARDRCGFNQCRLINSSRVKSL